jgi:hypothetical protein
MVSQRYKGTPFIMRFNFQRESLGFWANTNLQRREIVRILPEAIE